MKKKTGDGGMREMVLSWTAVDIATDALIAKLRNVGKTYEGVLAISLDGVIPALKIQEELCIPKFKVLELLRWKDVEDDVLKHSHILPEVDSDWLLIAGALSTNKTWNQLNMLFPYSIDNLYTLFAPGYAKEVIRALMYLDNEVEVIKFPWLTEDYIFSNDSRDY